MVLPVILIGSFSVMAVYFPIPAYQHFLSTFAGGSVRYLLFLVQLSTLGMLPVYLTAAINLCYTASLEEGLRLSRRLASLLSALTGFFILSGIFTADFDIKALSSQGLFSALLAGVFASVLYQSFERIFRKKTRLFIEGADSAVNASFQVMLPYLCVLLVFLFANYLITVIFGVSGIQELFIRAVTAVFAKMHRSFASGFLFILIVSLLWCFGIHGNKVLDTVAVDMFGAVLPGELVSKSFIDIFVYMGGTGTLLGLVISLFIFGRTANSKKLAKMSFAPALFNISELSMFGFPVVYNPYMVVPFVLVPELCYSFAYLMARLGFLPAVVNEVNWTTPLFLSGFLATGSMRAVFIQLVNLAISVAVYTPFLILYEKQYMSTLSRSMGLLDTESLARDYALDRLSEGIIAVDELGALRFFNRPALSLFPALERDVQQVTALLDRTIAAGEPLVRGGRIYTPEKNELRDGGTGAGTVYALIDDTEHFRYMDELKEQKQIADSANRSKSAFLATMSHEIRTPINAVLGMDEMILRESQEQATLSYAQDIQTAGQTLLSLINDILDFSKIEAGKMDIIPVSYQTATVLNDLVNMIEPRAEKKGLRLLVHVDQHLPSGLFGDEIRVKQVITNILTNAVKYTEQGSITLSVSFEKTDGEHIALRVSVADTGIGIKDEDIQKLFSAFERIEEKRNRSIEGTGLGMSITRQLLALMGSQLEVESVYGKGSTFSFVVEQKVESWSELGDFAEALRKARAARRRYHEHFTAPEAKILVVDDTPLNLKVIRGLLKQTRLGIVTAESGAEAVSLAKEQDFDVIFLDYRMPGMDGIETLARLKEECSVGTKNIPVICLTANAVSGAREEYLAAGFSDYLTKPIESERLETMLMDYLPPEKLCRPDGAPGAAPDAAAADNAVLPGWVSSLSGVDSAEGLKNCGSPDTYLDALEASAESLPDTIGTIAELQEAADWENYTIRVHAIKSSMRIIGASELSRLAERLEAAGNAQDIGCIASDTPVLLSQLRILAAELADVFPGADDASLTPIGLPQLKEAYAGIAEFAAAFDAASVDSIVQSLQGYRIPDEEKQRFAAVKKAAAQLDWTELSRLVKA